MIRNKTRVFKIIVLVIVMLLMFSALTACMPMRGKKGDTGPKGDSGISIVDSYINSEGNLILILSDGSEIDAGYVGSASNVPKYTIIFLDWDGAILKLVSNVESGSTVEAPTPPTRDNYIFVGWDTPFDSITSDTIVKAKYKSVKVYNDVFGVDEVLDEKKNKLTLTYCFSQTEADPVPIVAFQLRIVYTDGVKVLKIDNDKNVTSFLHEDEGYISVAYFNLSGKIVSSTFNYITVEFDISERSMEERVCVEMKYILDFEGEDMLDRVVVDSDYILESY